ncbi:MAG: HEAT repeat domain-containing protein, partial [Planctomycetes bacterium]|nr:HEAT repeat domain-containing protein [Planctomycetota bacterium]
KPQLLGSIYRIRRKNGAKTTDPLGVKVDWKGASHAALARLLADQRPLSRDRAREALATRGQEAAPAVIAFLAKSKAPEDRARAVWTLSRTGGPRALAALRGALSDSHPGVRQAAARSLGMAQDKNAVKALCRIVTEDAQGARRFAAEALGRIGSTKAVKSILQAMETSSDDYLDHALCYALIDIGDPAETLKGLASRSAQTRRMSLISLDRMGFKLSIDQVIPLLDTKDSALKRAAMEIAGRHPDWAKNISSLIDTWLKTEKPGRDERAMLRGAVKAFNANPEGRSVVAAHLEDEAGSAEKLSALLEAVARCGSAGLPAEWKKGFREVLDRDNEALRSQAVATLRILGETGFRERLLELANTAGIPQRLRISALAAVTIDRGK